VKFLLSSIISLIKSFLFLVIAWLMISARESPTATAKRLECCSVYPYALLEIPIIRLGFSTPSKGINMFDAKNPLTYTLASPQPRVSIYLTHRQCSPVRSSPYTIGVLYTKIDTYPFELTVTFPVTVMTQCLATRDQWNRNSDNLYKYTTYKNC
jgi:hypothetical protein